MEFDSISDVAGGLYRGPRSPEIAGLGDASEGLGEDPLYMVLAG
jgi:hypothetical protein